MISGRPLRVGGQDDWFLIRTVLQRKRGPAAEEADQAAENHGQRADIRIGSQHLPGGEFHEFDGQGCQLPDFGRLDVQADGSCCPARCRASSRCPHDAAISPAPVFRGTQF